MQERFVQLARIRRQHPDGWRWQARAGRVLESGGGQVQVHAPERCLWHGTLPVPEIVAEQSLRQAILNLLNNAADASPEHVDVEGQWNEEELLIRICDKGRGIPPEAADKIGKVFFTTKPPGQGNGMGLILTNAIISRFGGSVNLFNQPDACGACTEVRLPLAPFLVSAHL